MNSTLHTLLETLEAHCWIPVAPLTVTVWKTREPVPFAQRTSGERIDLKPGGVWGKNVFDCAWFHFTGTVPDTHTTLEHLALRIDANGELLLTDVNGVPLRGLTSRASIFAKHLGRPLKTIFQDLVEITAPHSGARKVECWADAGFNDLFGSISGDGSLVCAEIVEEQPAVRSLYYDAEVLLDAAEHFPEVNSFRSDILNGLTDVLSTMPDFSAEAAESARRKLACFFSSAEHSGMKISAVGHAHLDLAWLWPVRETIRKGARTFATALYLIERYPDYIFAASQPQLFEWIKAGYPELYRRIKNAVAAGRIEAQGAAWVECDMNVTGGESIVRQLLYGRRFFKEEFGIIPDYLWLPDVFGYNGQLPQILKKSGISSFLTQKLSWNLINRFPFHSFRWKGIDGSFVLAHMLPEDTYSSPALPRSLIKIQTDYAERAASKHALLAFGIGDGGGGPGDEHLERLSRLKKMNFLPEVRCESTADFLSKWKKDADAFPEWNGELYLERHQGTFTTQAKVKQYNRKAELMLRELEWIALAAEWYGGIAYPSEQLEKIWKEILLYQFHDILPGSSIERVYTETYARYEKLLAETEALITTRCMVLASGRTVFNPLPWNRTDWIKQDGEWIYAEVPAMGWVPVTTAIQPDSRELRASPLLLENQKLKVTFAADGTILSLYDKETRREISAGPINRLAVYEDNGDAWDIPLDYRKKPPVPLQLIGSTAQIDGPCAIVTQNYRHGKSVLTQRIILKSGCSLAEFDTEVDWNEPHRMLRAEFPVNLFAREASYEIQFGIIRRPTHNDTSWDKAKEEVPAQQWCDLSEENYGVSLINDCKYGHRVKGNVIELNLLRSAPYPDMALIESADRNKDTGSRCGDLGIHRFRYAIYPHQGDAVSAETMRKAREFNQPLRTVTNPRAGAISSLPASMFAVDSRQIDLTAIKKAEDGRGFIIRLCNMADRPCQTDIITGRPADRLLETNLTEEDETEVSPPLHFAPFEIKTFRLLQDFLTG